MEQNQSMPGLRPFTSEDAAAVVAMPQSPIEAQWWAGPRTPWPVPPDTLQRWHSDPDVKPFVLSSGNTLVGYGELWIDAEEQEVELARLIIAPEHRGKGHGVALVQLLREQVQHTGYRHVFLRVVPENQVAIRCYTRAGFTMVDTASQQKFNQGQPVAYLWMHSMPSAK